MATTSEKEHSGDFILEVANTGASLILSFKNELVKPIVKKCKEDFDRLLVFVDEGTAKAICKFNILGIHLLTS